MTLNSVLKDKIFQDVESPTLFERFMLGSIAGASAMTAVYPMYVIQNRLAAATPGQYNGMLDCARRTAQGGWKACYGGYFVSLLRVMPLFVDFVLTHREFLEAAYGYTLSRAQPGQIVHSPHPVQTAHAPHSAQGHKELLGHT